MSRQCIQPRPLRWLFVPALLALLGACTPERVREAPAGEPVSADDAQPVPRSAPLPEPTPPHAIEAAAVAPPAAVVATAEATLWPAIVSRYAFSECANPSPAVRRWQRIYLQSPTRHAESLARAAPWIAYVAEELARRDLPSEFVWLPFVESGYQPIRARGARPAGAWQLMPTTARWRGLRIDHGYDGRIDFVAATRAALDLIEYLARAFDRDWALVTMAYNAGEYRIKGALKRARALGTTVAPEKLAVSPTTHEHLVKLRALACVIAAPSEFALTLPEVDREEQLVALHLAAAMPVTQLAALAGVTPTQWQKWNPAWTQGHVNAAADVLVPRRLATAAAQAFATATPQPVPALAAASSHGPTHVVRAGESAWRIARRYALSVAELLAANALDASAVLHPGQILHLP